MGVLTDFVIATDEQAKAGLPDDGSIPRDERIDMKGIDHVKISKLDCILSQREWDAGMIEQEYPFVFEKSEDGPWVNRVSDALVRRLAALDGPSIDDTAHHWWQIEEFQPASWGPGWEQQTVHDVLTNLVRLARQAVQTQKKLFMWTSL
jgi:hypothetical protein